MFGKYFVGGMLIVAKKLSQKKAPQTQLSQTKYTRETSAVPFGKGIITPENLTPFCPEKKEKIANAKLKRGFWMCSRSTPDGLVAR